MTARRRRLSLASVLLLAGAGSGQAATVAAPLHVVLQAPFTTIVEAPGEVAGDKRLDVLLTVPPDAPADLGVGAFTRDHDGHWFQRVDAASLAPGVHRLSFALTARDSLVSEPRGAAWDGDAAARCRSAGIFFWSSSASRAGVTIDRLAVVAAPRPQPAHLALTELVVDGLRRDDGCAHAATGERWSVSCRTSPTPSNPYDPDCVALDLDVVDRDGAVQRVPGFWYQPMTSRDRGDREILDGEGAARFVVRYRPQRPGRYRLRLTATARGAATVTTPLPDLLVGGEPFDGYVRVDHDDPRFFACAGRWYWPIGLNLHSTYDQRSHDALGTRLKPPRGTLVYDAMLDRLAAAGGDAAEIWMSSWNLALEWRGDWPGYAGLGRYDQENAWRLDRVLDHAWARGIRINLVLNNHGQASPSADREWKDNPYNARLGGPLAEPVQLFTDAAAARGQDRLRRYLVARYADHPAILGWKLWSEVDLTAGRGEAVVAWHRQASARWEQLDVYHHPVTTHWAGDFRRVDPRLAALPGIDYLCIDSYRHAAPNGVWRLLADLLSDSMDYPNRGLLQYRKPVLTTEFGATSAEAPEPYRLVDHLTGAWGALVSGQAGAPMLWWWEWVDQGDRWSPYGAISRFVAGEDLRGAAAHTAALAADEDDHPLWARAWVRPGRLLGYLQDAAWGARGGEPPAHDHASIEIGSDVGAGAMTVAWWDADRGTCLATDGIEHPGGALRLRVPPFRGHLAFKLSRDEPAGEAPLPVMESP